MGIFSLLLLTSILANRLTGLKKMIFAAIAFSLCNPVDIGLLEETFNITKEPQLAISYHPL
jgi:hypothetical protein